MVKWGRFPKEAGGAARRIGDGGLLRARRADVDGEQETGHGVIHVVPRAV
jgi:hypothetical protein